MMRTDNIEVHIFINDSLFYTFGEPDTFVSYASSPGNLWTSTISPGITTSDQIRIEIRNLYTDHVNTTFSSFINNLYIGYESTLILGGLRQSLLNGFFTLFIICIGIISIGLACIMMKGTHSIAKLLAFGGLCISSGIWSFIDFNVQNYIFPFPVFNNSLDIISLLFSMFFLITYFSLYLQSNCKTVLLSLSNTILVVIVVTTLLQFLGIGDYYDYLLVIQLTSLLFTPLIVACIYYEKRYLRNLELNNLLLPTFILGIGIMGDAICNMLELIPYMIWFKISYAAFITIQFFHITKVIRNALLEGARIQILEELAYQDGLTGAGNRTAYTQRVEQFAHTIKSTHHLSIFVFDINDLKIINDTLGHESGDHLIQRASNILLRIFHPECTYRIGGDEFVVIIESDKSFNPQDYLKLLDAELTNSNTFFKTDPPISLAYGFASYQSQIDTCYEDLFSRADKNMYRHKLKIKQQATSHPRSRA